jgi:hypothetical protein
MNRCRRHLFRPPQLDRHVNRHFRFRVAASALVIGLETLAQDDDHPSVL